MRGLLKFAWLPILALPVAAAPFTVSTGTAAWTVTQTAGTANSGALNTTTSAVVLTGTLPVPPWQAAPSGSAWIGQAATDGNYDPTGNSNAANCNSAATTATCGAEIGTYVYTLTLAGGLGGTFDFGFSSDNGVRVVITGATTSYDVTSAAFALTNTGTISYAAGSTVVITATVNNDALAQGVTARNPSGFLASGGGNSVDPSGVPEPSTYAMLGLGGAGLLVARMRRGK